jgi:hypothetical protein
MGCGGSTTADNNDFKSRVPYFYVVRYDSIDNIFLNYGKSIINEIEKYRRIVYENMLELMITSGACCYFRQVPRFEDCLSGFFYKIAADSKGDIMSTNLKFNDKLNIFEIDASLISDDGKYLIKVLNNYVQSLVKSDMDKIKIFEDLDKLENDVNYEYKILYEKEIKKNNREPKEIFKKLEVNFTYIKKLKKLVSDINETINSYITMARDTDLRINEFKQIYDDAGCKANRDELTKAHEIYWNECNFSSRFGRNPEVGYNKWMALNILVF